MSIENITSCYLLVRIQELWYTKKIDKFPESQLPFPHSAENIENNTMVNSQEEEEKHNSVEYLILF